MICWNTVSYSILTLISQSQNGEKMFSQEKRLGIACFSFGNWYCLYLWEIFVVSDKTPVDKFLWQRYM